MTVYVAASSADIDRAERWIAALRAEGVTVTSTWPQTIRTVGSANPATATPEQRFDWVETDFREVADAAVLWLLVPDISIPTRGAWCELGYAHAHGMAIVCSGDTRQSIFLALGEEYATDEEAFVEVVRRVRK